MGAHALWVRPPRSEHCRILLTLLGFLRQNGPTVTPCVSSPERVTERAGAFRTRVICKESTRKLTRVEVAPRMSRYYCSDTSVDEGLALLDYGWTGGLPLFPDYMFGRPDHDGVVSW